MWTCSHSETGAAAMEAHIDSDPNKNGGLVTHSPPGKNLRAVPTTFVAPTPPRLRAHYPCAAPRTPQSLSRQSCGQHYATHARRSTSFSSTIKHGHGIYGAKGIRDGQPWIRCTTLCFMYKQRCNAALLALGKGIILVFAFIRRSC